MRRVHFACAVLSLSLFAGPFVSTAAAQEGPSDGQAMPIANSVAAAAQLPPSSVFLPAPVAQRRPAALVGLYASFVALQIGDMVTTSKALDNGGVEANPMMKGLTSNKGAMMAVKAGASLGTIYLSEKLWKKNRPAAIATMIIMNGAYAAIVANNARIARGK
jgi:hypothetical protein